jgi:hypothetical protein
VFLGPLGWVRDVAQARVALSVDDASALEAAGIAGETNNVVVGPYLIEVSVAAGRPVPVLRREQIRASGLPTIPFGLDVPAAQRRAA